MSKFSILIICSLIFIHFSCKPEAKQISELNIINPTESSRKFDLLDYIDDLEYIPLKESESTLLSRMVKMLKVDDQYIVKCHNRSALFFFDLKGNFIKKVVAMGEGPYEFSNMLDIAYNEREESIYLLDFDKKKILTYDLKQDRITKESEVLDLHAYSLAHYKSNIYAVSASNEFGRVKFFNDKSMQEVGNGIYGDHPTFNLIATQNNMPISNDTLFIGASFADTIYYSNGAFIKPYAILGYENTSLSSISDTEAYTKKYLWNREKMTETESKILIPRGFLSIYNNTWFIELIWAHKMIIWDKGRNIQKLIDFRNVENRYLFFDYQLFKIMFIDDEEYAYSSIILNDKFYASANKVVNSTKYKLEIIRAVQKILDDYPQGSGYENPVIVKYKLRTDFL